MGETIKMIVVLTAVAVAAAAGLSAVQEKTAPLEAENVRRFTLQSINKVVPDAQAPDPCASYKPAFDNAPDQDKVCIGDTTVYRARRNGEIVGIAVEAIGTQAYAGTMTVLVGLRWSDGMLLGIEVLRHAETPGLGSNMTKCTFQQQMVGKRPDDIRWEVAKDGGDIAQLSGATISSRSLLSAIRAAQDIWKEHRDEVAAAQPAKGACHGQ